MSRLKSKTKRGRSPGYWHITRDEWKRGKKPKWKKLEIANKSVVFGVIEPIDPKKPSKGIKGDLSIGGSQYQTRLKFSVGGNKKGGIVIEISAQSTPNGKKKR